MRGGVPGEEHCLVVEQVVEFAAVYFIEGDPDFHVSAVLQFAEDVFCCEEVQSAYGAAVAEHGVGFAAAGLSVREAGDSGPVEGAVNERSYCGLVDLRGWVCTFSLVANSS